MREAPLRRAHSLSSLLRHIWRSGVAVLALAALALAVLLSGPGEGRRVIVGFNNNAVAERVATPRQAAKLISDVGAQIDRVQVNWATLEPAAGRYHFGLYDAIYRADLAAGIRPLFVFAYAPNWAGDGACDSRQSSCHMAPGPSRDEEAARTAAVIAQRYPRLAGIEIWNEPNTPYFWAPRAEPVAYALLLKACYAAIKRVEPSMRVAGGSMSDSPVFNRGYVSAPDFLRVIYENGGKRAMDAISLHAYPDQGDLTGESALAALQSVRQVRDQFDDRSKPLWVTETGMTTTGPQAVSTAAQALVLLRLYRELQGRNGVKMILFHTLVDPPGENEDPESGFGVVGSDLRPKPAFCVLTATWGGKAC